MAGYIFFNNRTFANICTNIPEEEQNWMIRMENHSPNQNSYQIKSSITFSYDGDVSKWLIILRFSPYKSCKTRERGGMVAENWSELERRQFE